jgi:ABC-type antimicrobial peptide transport system permease subunit
MSFFDILRLSIRNLRQAKLRALLTTMGVIVGVAVIVTMVSFGLGLQQNMLARFGALDLFNEITVFGRSLTNLATAGFNRQGRRNDEGGGRGPRFKPDKNPTRILDDAALTEIANIPGVASVQPTISLYVYTRANGHVRFEPVSGAAVPNGSSRFKTFLAGGMISSPDADEAVVTDNFTEDFGFEKPADAVGQTIEFLAPPANPNAKSEDEPDPPEEAPANFFGIPLDEPDTNDTSQTDLVARKFRIVGVLDLELKEGPGQGGIVGMLPGAAVYVPVRAARQWSLAHRGPLSQVALALARRSGSLNETEAEGYDAAVIRVTDPVELTNVRKRLTDLGFGSFSIVDQIDQIKTVFLIIDSALGLLGGISLLVASFGIANTMIMSILERTREIGIMKAIGAEDREIKLIFFFEAAVIGTLGGVIGVLAGWGMAGLANRLAYRFILKPQAASYIDFFSLPPWLSASAIAFALTVSILAALYPAARAARIDPVRALRHD